MANRRSIEIEFDASEFERALKRLGAQQSMNVLAAATLEATQLVTDEVVANAPDSGLAKTHPRKQRNGRSYKITTDVVSKEVRVWRDGFVGKSLVLPYYAWMVEYGTSKMAARPFIRPAVERVRGRAVDRFKAALQRMISEALR